VRKYFRLIVGLTLVFLLGTLVAGPDGAIAQDLPLFENKSPPTGSTLEYVPDEIIVKFKPGVTAVAENQLHQNLRTSLVHASRYGGFKVLKIPAGKTVPEMVETYRRQSIVQYAEPNYIAQITWTPNDPYYSYQWHFAQINLPAAWDLDTTSPLYGGDSSIIVAVIDSGVAYENYGAYQKAPDLASTNFWVNSDEIPGNSTDDDDNDYVDDVNGWDFVDNDAHPNDDNSHGTHVTGTIAQSTNNSLGVAGIAFNTTIMPIKVANSAGNSNHSLMADGFYYAANNGAHIINLSMRSTGTSSTLENAVAYARNAGVVVIVAAGNDYQSGNPTTYPAAYNNYVIAVGATRYDQARSYYSNTGSYLDIAAPGGDITVDQNGDGFGDGVLQQTFDPDTQDPTDFNYWFFQGTSMACPHVAGVAALILAKNPTWTAAQVRHALESTATDIGSAGRDDSFGWGLMDAADAVGASLPLAASYKDSAHTFPSDNFSDYQTEHTVYMYFTGLLGSYQYRVAYYDGSDDIRATETKTSGASGNLSSQHTFTAGSPGTWHAILCDQAHDPPSTYNSSWSYMITQDTFTVQSSAIPEFPIAWTVIVALGFSAGLYLWLRRRMSPVPA
jgi:serine protease